MKGLIIPGAFAVVARALLVKGLTLQHRERALVSRLVPVRARVTDAGDRENASTFTLSDGTERRDVSYEGRYEYAVNGRIYTGTATSTAPVFDRSQLPPNQITVHYDPADPAVSRVGAYPDTTGRDYVRFALIVLAVALCMALIPNLGRSSGPPR